MFLLFLSVHRGGGRGGVPIPQCGTPLAVTQEDCLVNFYFNQTRPHIVVLILFRSHSSFKFSIKSKIMCLITVTKTSKKRKDFKATDIFD